jgi:hypothetical protein
MERVMCVNEYRHLDIGGKVQRIDSCIEYLVRVLNNNGIATVASCCGHFNRWGNIVLKDGRELIIAPDFDSGRAFDKIHGRPISDERRALDTTVAAQDGVPSGDKPPSLLDNASLTDRRVSDGVLPSDNTSQLAIAARDVVRGWKGRDMTSDQFVQAIDRLDHALQQQA